MQNLDHLDSFDKDLLLQFLLHHMDMNVRGKLMRNHPVIYNKMCKGDIVEVNSTALDLHSYLRLTGRPALHPGETVRYKGARGVLCDPMLATNPPESLSVRFEDKTETVPVNELEKWI